MQKNSVGLTLLIFLAIIYPVCVRADTLDLFVLAGQSNMHGFQGDASQYPIDVKRYDANIPFYWVTPGESSSEGNWLHLQAQSGRFPAGHFGPEITFARKLYGAGYRPAIFKFSLPSTSLVSEWKLPGAGGLYDSMITTLKTAVQKLEAQGHTVKYAGLVWIQGETDSENQAFSAIYGDRLKTLIADFRENVTHDPKLPILLGLDEQHPGVKNNPEVLNSQKLIAQSDKQVAFTSMIGLEKADVTHLTANGLQYHGNRLFEAFEKLTGGRKQHLQSVSEDE